MKKLIKLIFIILGAIILIIYCLPLFAGILNIGNIFGIIAGILLIIIGINFKKICDLHKNRIGKIIIGVTCIMSIIFSTAFCVTLFKVMYNTDRLIYGTETAIVLGCQVRGETPSYPLRSRTNRGAEYLKDNENTFAILCGGQGNGESISEAECMKRIMLENNIDESRLFLEDKSTSTEENLKYAKEILSQNGLSNEVIIITSDYHCLRAKTIAKSVGLDAEAIPVKTNKYSYPTFCTREVFGIWFYMLKNA